MWRLFQKRSHLLLGSYSMNDLRMHWTNISNLKKFQGRVVGGALPPSKSLWRGQMPRLPPPRSVSGKSSSIPISYREITFNPHIINLTPHIRWRNQSKSPHQKVKLISIPTSDVEFILNPHIRWGNHSQSPHQMDKSISIPISSTLFPTSDEEINQNPHIRRWN